MVATFPLKEREKTGFLKRMKEFSLSEVHPPPEFKKRAEKGNLIFTNVLALIIDEARKSLINGGSGCPAIARIGELLNTTVNT
jgi:hypothetical protein